MPLAPLAIAAAATTAAGKIAGGMSAASQYRAQARVADQNAVYAADQANDALTNTGIEVQRRYRQAAQLEGQQSAAMAANGIDLNFGSAGQVTRDTAMYANEDVAQLYKQGQQRAVGFDRDAWSYRASASSDRARASSAIVGSIFDATATALGGASQFAKLKLPKPSSSSAGFGP